MNIECVITRYSWNVFVFAELMILGFISLLFNVFQGAIGRICMPKDFAYHMLPCKRSTTVPAVNHFSSTNFVDDHNYNIHRRHLLSASSQANFQHCSRKVRVSLICRNTSCGYFYYYFHIYIFFLNIMNYLCYCFMNRGRFLYYLWKHCISSTYSYLCWLLFMSSSVLQQCF